MASDWVVVGEILFIIIIILRLYHSSLQAPVNVKALEKQLQQKKDSEPIMAGILEEVRLYFQASLLHSAAPHLIGKHVRQSEKYRVLLPAASSLQKKKKVFLREFKSVKLTHVENDVLTPLGCFWHKFFKSHWW